MSQVTQYLAERNIRVETDDLRYNLLDLSLQLRNVRVQPADATAGPPFAVIRRARLDLGLFSALRGRYVVQDATVEGLEINYLIDEHGRDNLPRMASQAGSSGGSSTDFLITDLRVTDAHVRFEDHRQGLALSLPVSSLRIRGDRLTDRHHIEARIADGELRQRDETLRLQQLTADLDVGDDDVKITSIEAQAEGARATVTGSVSDFDDPRIATKINAQVDTAWAARRAALTRPVSGMVQVEADVTGAPSALAISGSVTGADLQLDTIRDVDVAARVAYDMAARTAQVASATLRSPIGNVDAQGGVALDATGTSRLTASVEALDAATLMRALDLPYVAATRVDAQLSATWPGLEYARAAGEGRAHFTPTTGATAARTVPLAGRLDLTATNGVITARLDGLRAADLVVNGRVTVRDQTRLDGTVAVRAGDLARSAAAAERLLGRRRGSLLPVALAGTATADARITGTVQSPVVAATVAAPRLSVAGARDISAGAEVTYSPAALDVGRLDVAWREARAHASGRVGLQGAERLDLAFTANTIELDALLDAAGRPSLPVSGVASLSGHVGGTATNPAARASIRVDDVVAYGETLGTLTANATLANQEVLVPALVLDKPQRDGAGRLAGSAAYHLDRETYRFDLRSDNLRLDNVTLPDGRHLAAVLQLDATGTGTLRAPSASVALSADEVSLAGTEYGDFDATALVAGGQATIKASSGTFQTTVDGVIGVDEPYRATLAARVNDLALEDLPFELGTPLDGRVSASLEATDDLGQPRAMRAEVTLHAFEGRWNTHPFGLTQPALLRYADERLAVDRLELAAQDSTFSVRGELPLTDRAGAGSIDVDGTFNLATLAGYAPAGTDVTAAGTMRLQGSLAGTLQAIDPRLTLTIDDAMVTTPDLSPGLSHVSVRARVGDGQVIVEDARANWVDARLSATAIVPLDLLPELPVAIPRRGGPARLQASIAGLDPGTLPGAPENLEGYISAEADLSAARADLGALEGRISFSELALGVNDIWVGQEQPATIAFADGSARIEAFNVSGAVAEVRATGSIGLTGDRGLGIDLRTTGDLALLSTFTDAVRAEGPARLELTARGTMSNPDLNGTLTLTDATVVVDEPLIGIEGLTARARIAGTRVALEELRGRINGGTLNGSGTVTLAGGTVSDVDLQVTTQDFAFDAPLDLRSLSNATLRMSKRGELFVVDGKVEIEEAGLTGDINFDQGLLAAVTARKRLDLTEERSELLERVRFNVSVTTLQPVLIENNLAEAEATVDVRVVGTPYQTGLTGRLTLLDGGEVTLNERRYEVERGVITFVDERRIMPSFDLQLTTTAGNYDITLGVTGTPGETETTLQADPALPEPDIMALLVTGRTLDDMRGEEYDVAREQVMSYLVGRVGSTLGRSLERATGLSQVRIEPNLIANEADPGARLTLGQELTDKLDLVYSTNLTNSNDQIWVARYDLTRRFQTRGVRQSDNSYRFDFSHDVRFGGRPEPRRVPRTRPTIASIEVPDGSGVAESELRRLLDLEVGKPYDFFLARAGIDRIERHLHEQGRLQARVRLDRTEEAGQVRLALQVRTGPLVELRFAGADPPGKVRDAVREQWSRGVFDAQRADDAQETLRAWMIGERHLDAKLDVAIGGTDEHRDVVFTVAPGPRFDELQIVFDGASGIEPDQLNDIIDDQDLEEQLFTDPLVVTTLLTRYYREQGYLTAEIKAPRYEFEGAVARAVLAVDEGPRFSTRTLATTGNQVIPTEALVADLPLEAGATFLPAVAERSLERIRDLYWQRGYNDVRSDYELVVDEAAGTVDVTLTISEGRQARVAGITVVGNEHTDPDLVREQLQLAEGDALDLSALGRSRRSLYDTGAYSIVDITRDVAEGDGGDGTKPVDLTVQVREVQPYQLQYGVLFDTERGPGGILDLANHNSLGQARVVGVRSRYDARTREIRSYFSQPTLKGWPVQTSASVYYSEERHPDTELTRALNVNRAGLSIQQEKELGNSFLWMYGYRFERARTFDPDRGGRDETTLVSPLTSTFTREGRDEVLDASRGSFMSQALSYSPSWLGSDHAYIKYLGQYFHYVPLRRPTRKPLTNEILRPRLVYAVGVRLGLAHSFDSVVPSGERFLAGGSTTLRGFAQDAAGPVAPGGTPLGGEALFVLNNELRVPLISILDGVVFADVGNVFGRVSDFSFGDLRETAGVGIRVRTPWFVVRGDYGFVLDQRPGERGSRFYFSIGQAF